MFEVNRKMMLCAAVGGDIGDYENMILTRIPYVKCPHVLSTDVNAYEPSKPHCSASEIELKRIVFSGESIGSVGKCSTCNKIYYGD